MALAGPIPLYCCSSCRVILPSVLRLLSQLLRIRFISSTALSSLEPEPIRMGTVLHLTMHWDLNFRAFREAGLLKPTSLWIVFRSYLLILKSFRWNSLFVEGLVISAEFALAQDASLPPCRQESATIAHQLGKCCSDTQYANLQTLILFGTVDN